MTQRGDTAAPPAGGMMAELAEADARGEIARIYDELRVYCGVPYVSSLQRHVATMPGCLEYAWAAVRPAFVDGTIPTTAWRLASMVDVAPHPPLTAAAMRLLGVDAAGVRAIRNVCENFVRVAPINLLLAGCVEKLLGGARTGGAADTARAPWSPLPMLEPMPAMVDLARSSADVRDTLLGLATEIGGRPFVPGLYRLVAPWPAYLAHAATLIRPALRDEAARRARAEIAHRIIGAADDVLAALPLLPADRAPPSPEQASAIVAAIHTYRVTSPEMIVFGTLLRDALPD